MWQVIAAILILVILVIVAIIVNCKDKLNINSIIEERKKD